MVAELTATGWTARRQIVAQAPGPKPVRGLGAQEVERLTALAARAPALQEPARVHLELVGPDREAAAQDWEAMEPGLARELGAAAAAAAVEAELARVRDLVLEPERELAALVPSRESLGRRMANFKRWCWVRQTPPRPIPKVPGC
jgi:hypothetical protein